MGYQSTQEFFPVYSVIFVVNYSESAFENELCES